MSVVDEIKQRVDLVDLVSRYTPIKKAGTSFKGHCPFHSERTPSFVVYSHTGTWRCFGACGVGGDAFTFLMKAENLDFREALETLAKEVGVALDEPDADPERKQRARLLTINQAAATYFEKILADHPQAAVARAYLNRREIDDSTAKHFGLGYALDEWDQLLGHLTGMGYSTEELLQAGLLKHNEERNRTYDAFRGRLIIPITDRQGRCTGFGGRVLDDRQPKYLNTAETVLFHKSRTVYGIDKAYRQIAGEDRVVIVEGYMDVIAAHQHGFTNVVACMGTSVTAEQLQQLQKYTNNFVLALDADNAGQQATIRALNQARQALTKVKRPRLTPSGRTQMVEQLGANLSILSMPAGMDPDDVIRNAPDGWTALVDGALPLVDYYIEVVAREHDSGTPQGKAAIVSEVAGLIAELGSEIERDHYVQKLGRQMQVREELIDQTVRSAMTTIRATGRTPGEARQSKPAEVKTEAKPSPLPRESPVGGHRRPGPPIDHEDHLVANLLNMPSLLVWAAGAAASLEIPALQATDLQRIENQEILLGLKRHISSDEPWDPELFQDQLTEQLHGHLGRLVAYGIERPQSDELALQEDTIRALVRVRLQRLGEQSVSIGYLLEEAKQANEADAVDHYKRLQNQLNRNIFHLQRIQLRLGVVLFNQGRKREGMKIR